MTDPVPAAPAPSQQPARRSAPSEGPDRFVAYVHGLCESTRIRAELRRGVGLPVERCNYLHRYLVPWLAKTDETPRDARHPDAKRAHYAVAALIAARPRTARQTPAPDQRGGERPAWYARANLGASLGQAVTKGVMKPGTAESTLHLMSRQSAEAIHPGLPALTRQLLTGGVSVDWAVLLVDLSRWNRDRDRIATRWLESYFRTTSAEQTPHADNDTPPATPDTFEETER